MRLIKPRWSRIEQATLIKTIRVTQRLPVSTRITGATAR